MEIGWKEREMCGGGERKNEIGRREIETVRYGRSKSGSMEGGRQEEKKVGGGGVGERGTYTELQIK